MELAKNASHAPLRKCQHVKTQSPGTKAKIPQSKTNVVCVLFVLCTEPISKLAQMH